MVSVHMHDWLSHLCLIELHLQLLFPLPGGQAVLKHQPSSHVGVLSGDWPPSIRPESSHLIA